MDFIMEIIGWPLGFLMRLMYQMVNNYGIALILFTIVTKLIMVPLSIKQHKSTVKGQILQPKMKEIQDKYKNNPNKMNEELQALYQRENYSMAAGCLPTIVQFALLFGLLDVVYKPLTHLLQMGKDSVALLSEIVTANGGTLAGYTKELTILSSLKAHPGWFTSVPDIVARASSLDLNFLGLDLSATPNTIVEMLNPFTWGHPVILVPLLSGLTAFAVSMITTKMSGTEGAAGSSMKMMMLSMPLISLWITFTFPTGAGLYWIVSNIVAATQTLILYKYWNPKELVEKMKADEEERRVTERQEKIEAKKKAKEMGIDTDDEALSQKELNRRKILEARRRHAEKYGEVFVDDGSDS